VGQTIIKSKTLQPQQRHKEEDKLTDFVPKWVNKIKIINLKGKQENLAFQPCLKNRWGKELDAQNKKLI
jgi:hypothetical protein